MAAFLHHLKGVNSSMKLTYHRNGDFLLLQKPHLLIQHPRKLKSTRCLLWQLLLYTLQALYCKFYR